MAQASTQTLRQDLAREAVQLAHTWVRESADYPTDPAAERLAGVLKDPNGLPFTVGFVDGVMRPEDLFVAGYGLQKVAKLTPQFLPWYMRAAIACGGVLGPVIPGIVIPISRRVLREMVGHLVVDATPERLGPAIAQLRADGSRLNLNLLGEAVLGEKEAQRRFDGTLRLLERDDVDYVSIKVSSIVSQLSMWAFDEAVEHVVEKLIPLYQVAAEAEKRGHRKFINLDMEEYRDLDLTIAVFTHVLEHDDLKYLEAGIVLQAYLPDALSAMQQLTAWARVRRSGGGAPIKVRLVKGANIPMENVDAQVHGWPAAPYSSKQDTDANYKRVLEWSMTPENTDAVRVGVAGHNLFDVAYAWLLAKQRGVSDAVDFEMLLGMATGQAKAVRRVVGNLLLYTPVVNPHEFDVAISYLIRRLEENASTENFMSVVYELHENNTLLERETKRFLASIEELGRDGGAPPEPNRTQNRQTEWTLAGEVSADASAEGVEPAASTTADLSADLAAGVTTEQADDGLTQQVLHLGRPAGDKPGPFDTTRVFTGRFDAVTRSDAGMPGFHNTPDTDPALPANREWGREIIARMEASRLGIDNVQANTVTDASELERIIETVRTAGAEWGAKSGAERGAVIERAGDALSAHRDSLLEVMGSETGKTIAEGDPEVSEAVDFAHYYGAQARQLDRVQGAVFEPSKLIVVTPPWNFPLAIPTGGVLAGLASGAGVIIKPAPQAERTAAVMVEALWEAGVPRELLAYVSIEEGELGKQLISHDAVDRVILTGAWDTAKLFRSWKPTLPLLAETSGKNALVVMPSADMDLAAADLVKSAFGHAGQKCSASSLVILVGSAAKSERFHRQLVDAAMSLRVGYPSDPSAQMGPIIEPAEGKLLHALTELGVGEEWLVEPKRLDRSGQLWSPGIRTGVKAGSYFHLTEFFGPVLGVMHARTLDDAIRYVNAIEYGLTSGLHTQDPNDLAEWLAGVEAGNLYVNRGITGAIVQRQPFGGWKRSSVGAGTKAGGPSYLYGLGSWRPARGSSSSTLHLRGLDSRITRLIESAQPSMEYEQFDVLRRSALSDAVAWANEYGEVTEATGLDVERNLLRYRAMPVAIRATVDAALSEVLRVVVAGVRARSRVTVSTAAALPTAVLRVLDGLGVPVTVESDAEWVQRTAHPPVRAGEADGSRVPRVRLVGSDAERRAALHRELADAVEGDPDLAIYAGPVTQSGRVEMLPFLREQSISITMHRFGTLDPWSNDVI
ncbi:bifunctional proline dehydrogenase/L-glutamate gamma-semialdehyde dehydrogenase [Paramicrobacterium fandaimingii]|uniref:bifunctional proline dehydrogenase/L-glutamate gamma-semialdehyde dehydrogenase n=1 Tax=Paramicrobacterium fandaimingii TaxID=2708079 RepID=UPI001422D53C|nr:bifunctional proline dehydrogenase/L-glutamate gamma-semialdehyde dehydrogenase [Microbacterium fandaimingii]